MDQVTAPTRGAPTQEGDRCPEYMLSVHHVEGEPMPGGEDMQRVYDEVDAFNSRLQEAGVWVFAGGLMPPDTATTVDNTAGRGARRRRAVRRDQGVARRLLGHHGARPGRRPRAGRARTARARVRARSRSGRF